MTAEESRYIGEVAKKERGRLLNYIRKNIPSSEDAEDIMQDVLYQFLKGFEDIRETERITSWLFTVARNRITDYFRKMKPENLGDKILAGRDPEDEMMREMIWTEIEQALKEIPEEQRDVFVWNEFEDRSFKEISKQTGEGINTLLSRKRYAILFLREKLEELYNQL